MLYLEKSNIPKRPPGCEVTNGIAASSFPLSRMVCLCARALRIGLTLPRLTLNVFAWGSAYVAPRIVPPFLLLRIPS